MATRTFAIVLVICLAAAALLLALADVLDSFALAVGGVAALMVLGVARFVWTNWDD